MRIGVVTVVAGRHDHLRTQLAGLARCRPAAMVHVVVSMGDGGVAGECAPFGCEVLDVGVDSDGLPLAAARNAGAAALLDRVDLLVFLDVDCIPAPDLLGRYATASAAAPDALLSGPVTYLPRTSGPYDLGALATSPHPARPDPAPGVLQAVEAELFWSLSFAVTPAVWRRIGGFCEAYVGYGGEDTDFGQLARAAGVPHLMVGGAHAYHQWHPVQRPPVGHVADLVRNGALFARRWGWWPMQGWFEELADLGVVHRVGPGYAEVV